MVFHQVSHRVSSCFNLFFKVVRIYSKLVLFQRSGHLEHKYAIQT
jgi:hypothetical protein